MVQLSQTYVTNEVKTTSYNNVKVPDADYKAIILNSRLDKSPFEGKPDDLVLDVVITEGEYQDTKFEHRLGINDNTAIKADKPTFTWAVAALGNLGQIADALGLDNFNNTELFHNKPLLITTMTSKGKDKETGAHKPEWDVSRIKSYSALPSVGVSGANQGFTPPAQDAAQTQHQATQSTQATQPAQSSDAPPWAS